ncbi:MAG: hypothetical protein HY719_04235 [Planctomycetes bacterium]|nr:hypothetical protein [Planctomycetota bacterium]
MTDIHDKLNRVLAGERPSAVVSEISVYDILCTCTSQELHEATFGRIFQHFVNRNARSFALLTAWRAKHSYKENRANMDKLQQWIRSAGGSWIKVKGRSEEKREEGGEVVRTVVKEPAMFAMNIPLKLALRVLTEFSQTSVIFAGPETEGEVRAYMLKDGKPHIDVRFTKIKTALKDVEAANRPEHGDAKTKPARREELERILDPLSKNLQQYYSRIHGKPWFLEHHFEGISECFSRDVFCRKHGVPWFLADERLGTRYLQDDGSERFVPYPLKR